VGILIILILAFLVGGFSIWQPRLLLSELEVKIAEIELPEREIELPGERIKDKTSYITVFFPPEGVYLNHLIIGKTYKIIWESKEVDKVDIFLCSKGPATDIEPETHCLETPIAIVDASIGKYDWTATHHFLRYSNVFIRIIAKENSMIYGDSEWFSTGVTEAELPEKEKITIESND